MKTSRELILAGVIAAAMAAAPAWAQSTATTNTQTDADAAANVGVKAVDAGKLINENVYDAKGDKVGEIESVIVDTSGKVTSVVLDVGGWLSGDKRISVPWKDLKASSDGKIVTSITQEEAQKEADYKYKQDSMRGKVLTATGDVYGNADQTVASDGSPTTNQNTANGNTSQNASLQIGTPVKNADGSMNASQIIGMKVINDSDENIGKVGELVLGKDGKVSGVVVDVGGFLGIATHPVLLDWKQVSLADEDGTTRAIVKMSKDQLKQMPAYEGK